MLEGNVEVGKDEPFGHQRNDVVHVGVGVDIMQPHPGAELAEFTRQIGHVGADLFTLPHPRLMPDVDAIGAGVLTDDQQLPRSGSDELLGLAQYRVGAAADEVAAKVRDDAEGAAVIAALGDLQIAIMPGRELETRFGHQINERRWDRWRGFMNGRDDFLILLGPGDREHVGEAVANDFGFLAHAARDDDAAIFGNRFPDSFEAFFLGRIEKAAGVDEDHVGAGIVGRHFVPVGAQLGHDLLAVDECLGQPSETSPTRGGLGRVVTFIGRAAPI